MPGDPDFNRSAERRKKSILTKTAVASVAGMFAAAPLSASAADFSTVYVMTDNLGDHGFNDSAATGFRRAEEEGAEVRLLQA